MLLLSALLFGRRITALDVFAVAVSYVGIAVVFVNDLATQPGNVVRGSLWVMASALLYATYLLGSGRLVGRVGSMRFACYAGVVSCIGVVAHFLVTRDWHLIVSQPGPVYGLSILMAAVSTVMPIVLTSEGIRRIGASHASIVGLGGTGRDDLPGLHLPRGADHRRAARGRGARARGRAHRVAARAQVIGLTAVKAAQNARV